MVKTDTDTESINSQETNQASSQVQNQHSIHKEDWVYDLIAKLAPIVEKLDYQLRDLHFYEGSEKSLRVTIDHKDRSRRIGIEDCSKVHGIIGPLFDLWDPIEQAYSLEVSSPGSKVPLRTLEHFSESIGYTCQFQTLEAFPMPEPAKPRKRWKGKLLAVNREKAEISLEDYLGTHIVPIQKIKEAYCDDVIEEEGK